MINGIQKQLLDKWFSVYTQSKNDDDRYNAQMDVISLSMDLIEDEENKQKIMNLIEVHNRINNLK